MNTPVVTLTLLHPHCRLTSRFKAALQKLAGQALAAAKHRTALVSVVFVDDRRIRTINRTYHNSDRATDVLAFGLYHDAPTKTAMGDVYVSLDHARTQARTYGVTFENEVTRLTLHGVLHLCGWLDGTKKQRAAMEQQVECWVKKL